MEFARTGKTHSTFIFLRVAVKGGENSRKNETGNSRKSLGYRNKKEKTIEKKEKELTSHNNMLIIERVAVIVVMS
jgi:hypothetical protein